MGVVVAVAAALGAALLYAVASVLQHRAALEAPAEQSMRIGLLARLIGKPWWLAGVAADIAAFGLQFLALGYGALAVVQPLLVSGLLFALPLGAWVSGRKVTARELRWALLTVAGLAVLLVCANPSAGHADLPGRVWALVVAAVLIPSAAILLVADRMPASRPALLSVAAGALYAFTAALAKTVAHDLGEGVTRALSSWQLYALIPAGLVGMLIVQSAFQAGPLRASLPSLTAVDPVVSIAIGVLAFHEHVGDSALQLIAEATGLAALVIGVLALARSPIVALEDREEPAWHASQT